MARSSTPAKLEPQTVTTDAVENGELPEGWEAIQLGGLLELSYGKGLVQEDRRGGNVPVFGSNGIVGYHNNSLIDGPCIIVGRKGSVGEVHFSKGPCWPIDTTYFVNDFRGQDEQYIYYSLRSLNLAQLETSTAIPGLNRQDTYGKSLNIPPLAEQKRIVAKVEALLARVNAARERLAKVPPILKRFRQSVLAAACSGRLTEDWREEHSDIEKATTLLKDVIRKRIIEWNAKQAALPKAKQKQPPVEWVNETQVSDGLPDIPNKWTWVKLPILGELNRGKSKHRPRNAPHLFGGPFPFIQTGEVARSGGRITKHSQTYSQAGLSQSRLWPKDTVCITIAANIADTAILTYPACFPDSVVGFIADVSLTFPEYVEFFLRTARENLSSFAPATAQKNINLEILGEVAVPFPPLAEQREIVRRVEKLFNLADAIEKRVAAATARADRLTQAILAKAFRGELVPTEADLARRENRPYESAAELLIRIQSERTEKESQKGTKNANRKGSRRT